jgi:hypothetical protein
MGIMNGSAALPSRVVVLLAVAVAGWSLTAGSANAADRAGTGAGGAAVSAGRVNTVDIRDFDRRGRNAARNGSGSTAVNASGGGGTATQTATQPQSDTSTHTYTVTAPRTDSHNSTNSHNSTSTEDSHDQTSSTR